MNLELLFFDEKGYHLNSAKKKMRKQGNIEEAEAGTSVKFELDLH
jgi:hypothetical protein